jgi:hypothetical protein
LLSEITIGSVRKNHCGKRAPLRLVLDALPVGVAVVGPSGDILLSNPASQLIWVGRSVHGHSAH